MKVAKMGSILLTCALSVSMVSACSSNNGNNNGTGSATNNETSAPASKEEVAGLNTAGFPIVNDKITVKGFAAKLFANADWNNLKLWQEYEKMTNVHMVWDTTQKDSLKEKRNILLAGGEYPELFYASAFSRSDLFKYGKQGVFVPLNDLIDNYAPHFKALMDKYPIIGKGITMPDGNIYGLPTIYDPEFKSVFYNTPWVKKEWLDKLGIAEPQNLDDFYNMLKAFKEKDPNGNSKQDEIAWGGVGTTGLLGYLKGSFGLNNHGNSNAYVDTDPSTGKLRFVATDPNYKELLQYVNKLYKDGLLEKDIVSVQGEEIDAKGTGGLLAIIDNVDPVAIYNQQGYVGLPVLKGPHGDQTYTYIGSPLGNIGMFVLTDKAKNQEAMMRWMDYFYSEEGIKLFFMGWKDQTYKEHADGTVDYTDEIKSNPNGLSLDQAVSQYLVWPGGYYPGFVKQQFFKGAEGLPTSVENAKKSEALTLKPDQIWPAFNFTSEEQTELTTLATDIQTYVDEMRDKFIVGNASFDEWDNYVATLNKMGLDRYIAIYQAALDRFTSQ
ncbi:ABC transporter substrate-binding protein [Paenibacillus sp. BC26]|uniref:ABC transporter substrate-binding protein n=1 Tax=Paenibacillus sp. BC26 TaxID=1881032 RepID=UPI0008E60914|nr:ABC transporter substrate-binding protein [Paenibacillus sp. BC26]SFS52048.1 carbohydrate ABC transporter substrate-binding protein, CUT1 family [Paenibacillus sp. BC26]